MDIIRITDDFVSSQEDKDLAMFIKNKIQTDVCEVKLTNKEYMVRHLEPLNDFVIHTTAMPCCEPYRLLG